MPPPPKAVAVPRRVSGKQENDARHPDELEQGQQKHRQQAAPFTLAHKAHAERSGDGNTSEISKLETPHGAASDVPPVASVRKMRTGIATT